MKDVLRESGKELSNGQMSKRVISDASELSKASHDLSARLIIMILLLLSSSLLMMIMIIINIVNT